MCHYTQFLSNMKNTSEDTYAGNVFAPNDVWFCSTFGSPHVEQPPLTEVLFPTEKGCVRAAHQTLPGT